MCKLKSILIVEDEAVNALALKLMLTTAAISYWLGGKRKKSCDEALKKIPGPYTDGYKACRRNRRN